MIVTKDLWLTLTPAKRLEKIVEVLTQLKEIDTKNSQRRQDQGRLANVKTDLEKFIINAISWESDRQLNRHY